MYASEKLAPGQIYTRVQLAELFCTSDATINNGVFPLRGTRSIFLFVTAHKSADRTQYIDRLDGDVLHWQGQMAGRTDRLIIGHDESDHELVVFYRESKRQHAGAGFVYVGRFRHVSHHGSQPTSFVLQRIDDG